MLIIVFNVQFGLILLIKFYVMHKQYSIISIHINVSQQSKLRYVNLTMQIQRNCLHFRSTLSLPLLAGMLIEPHFCPPLARSTIYKNKSPCAPYMSIDNTMISLSIKPLTFLYFIPQHLYVILLIIDVWIIYVVQNTVSFHLKCKHTMTAI